VIVLKRISLGYEDFIIVIILLSTLTSFAFIPTAPATIPCYFLILLFIVFFVFFPKNNLEYKKTINQFIVFLVIYFLYTIVTQLTNWLLPVQIPQDVFLVDSDYSKLLFKGTLFTQSAYLIINVFFYLTIKNYPNPKLLKYIIWTFRILLCYALYEFFYYLIFSSSGDFISNRIFTYATEADAVGSSMQLQYIGVTTLLRIKGYVGEPSMFAFVVLPYLALSLGLKNKVDTFLCIVSLIFTFSTTAYLGLFIIIIYMMFFSPNKKTRLILTTALVGLLFFCAILFITNEIVQELVDVMFVSKLSGQSVSGDQRSSFFLAAFNFWRNSDFLHFLFGYGFGYARSTDFLSTLLFNVGLIGFLGFTCFVFSHFLILIPDKAIRSSYRLAVILIYISMIMSVPEFAYTSIWVLFASGFVLKACATGVSNDTYNYNMN
jgi:hypothetical protein